MDFYSLLGVSSQATQQEIRVGFKRCALLVHPDKSGGSKDAFQQVLLGFETLSDAQSRALYDEKLMVAGQKTSFLIGKPTQHVAEARDVSPKTSKRDEGGGNPSEKVSQKEPRKRPPEAHRAHEPLRTKSIVGSTLYRAGIPFFEKIYFLLRRLSKERRRRELAQLFARQFQLCLEIWISERQCTKDESALSQDCSGTPQKVDDCTAVQAQEPLALCDAHPDMELAKDTHDFGVIASPEDGGYVHQHENPKHSIPGICRSQASGKTWYAAEVHVESLLVRSRYALDLEVTLDHLVLLTAMKQQIVQALSNHDVLADTVKHAVANILNEHGVTAEEIGLRYKVQFCWSMGPQLCTPIVRDLDLVLDAWEQLRPFRSPLRGGRSSTHEYMESLHRFGREWPGLRSTYLAIVERAGLKVSQWAARVDAAEQKSRPSRQHRLEICECYCMADEERRERHRQACERREREREHVERCAMAGEDRQSVHEREKRLKVFEASLAQRLKTLSKCWKQRLARLQAQKMRRHKVMQAVAAAKSRNAIKRHLREREAHWKWMNRPDITTADLLSTGDIAAQPSFPECCKRRKLSSEQSQVSFAIALGA
mmetsp:Transcript_96161/g.150449  ORF Transcript_96161/g.150449 Transcript_96161/m.150449 type:complete len:597 (+) Transcript_96161:87-1877(+)